MTNDFTFTERKNLIDGYQQWFEKWITHGFEPYLLSALFKPIKGSDASKILIMEDSIRHLFKIILNNTVRGRSVHEVPRMIAVPDKPVLSHKEVRPAADLWFREMNNGLHFHGALFIPKKNRLSTSFIEAVRTWMTTYLWKVRNLLHLDIREFRTEDMATLADYVFKNFKNGRLPYDPLILGPKGST